MIRPTSSWQIAELEEKYLDQAAKIYAQGLLMEIPPGSTEPLETLADSMRRHLKLYLQQKGNRHIWLAILAGSIKGLLDFYHKPSELFIRFICAIPSHQGTGTWLLQNLAQYGVTNTINFVKTTVSSLDPRACSFYFDHLKFQKIGTRTEDQGFDLFLAAIQPRNLLKHTRLVQ